MWWAQQDSNLRPRDYESRQIGEDRRSKPKIGNKVLVFASVYSDETGRIPNLSLNFSDTEPSKLKNWQGFSPTELRTFSELFAFW